MQLPRHVICTIILMHAFIVRISSFPHNAANDDMEIITVEEIVHFVDETKNSPTPLITQNNEDNSSSFSSSSSKQNDASNEPMIDIADDLIFLAARAKRTAEQKIQQYQQQPSTVGTSQQIALPTSDEEDSLTADPCSWASSDSTEGEQNVSESTKNTGDDSGGSNSSRPAVPQIKSRMRHVSADNTEDNDDDDDDDETETADDDDDDTEDDPNATNSEELDIPSIENSVTPIDMSDFVAIIPVAGVKSIVANYYLNDPDVQYAYAYLNSKDFEELRQNTLDLPEVKSFLRYLNNSGLDVVGFLNTLTNFTSKPDVLLTTTEESMADTGSGSEAMVGNEIENGLKLTQVTTTSSAQTEAETTTEKELFGVHGMVDSILEILPQDQILSTFFEKLESNEQFSKLVDSIGRPAFAKILHNMRSSSNLRNASNALHHHRIYIRIILDSIKAYFFLGTF